MSDIIDGDVLHEIAAELKKLEQRLIDAGYHLNWSKVKEERYTIKALRFDHDWDGSLWFGDVYARNIAEAWAGAIDLFRIMNMDCHEVTITAGKTQEYVDWEEQFKR